MIEATISPKRLAALEAADARNQAALAILEAGVPEGAHHLLWLIDQIAIALTGPDYDRWVAEYCDGVDGPNTYDWDTGIAP